MLPELFKCDEQVISQDKMKYSGRITKASSCIVTENKNGDYTLSMSASYTDEVTKTIEYQDFILAKPNPTDTPQYFEVYEISTKVGNVITVKAKHIKHSCYNNILVSGDLQSGYGTPKELWDEATDDVSFPVSFSFSSDITTKSYIDLGFRHICTIGDFLGGSSQSLLSVFNGEYKYDNFNIQFLKSRGKDKNFYLRYGTDCSSIEQTINCDDTASHIIAFAKVKDSATGGYVELCCQPYELLKNACKHQKVLLIDAQTIDTAKSALKDIEVNTKTGENYSYVKKVCDVVCTTYRKGRAETNGVPSFNMVINIQVVLDKMKEISLCDTVHILTNAKDDEISAQIIKTEYDTLLECYKSLEIGTPKKKITDFI